MANHRFENLIIIDKADLKDINTSAYVNAVFAKIPDTLSDAFNHYDLAEAVHQQFQVNIQVQDISSYGQGYFLHVHTADAKINMLRKGIIIVQNYMIALMPWNPEHGSTAVPLQTVLTSCPLNVHLAKSPPLTEPYEHLTIQIRGVPPHLCCNSLIYRLFNRICIIHGITFLSGTAEYDLSARGRLTMVPQTAHLGIRNLTGQNDIISIWRLCYQTFTDEMLGRQTPPGERRSELRGNNLCYKYTAPNHRDQMLISLLSQIHRILGP